MEQPVQYLPNWEQVGQQFVEHYYRTFASNRESVIPLYHPQAMLTYEEKQAQGPEKIKEVINKLEFQKIAHQITKVDIQPTPDSGVIILVTGLLKTDEDRPLPFSQTFAVKAANNSCFIFNDIFRLSLHNQ